MQWYRLLLRAAYGLDTGMTHQFFVFFCPW